MLIKQDGNLQKRQYTTNDIAFSYILSIFIDHVCFADHEHVFWANTCIFRICIFTIRCCIFCISWHCLLFMERFVCNLHAYSACLQYMFAYCDIFYWSWVDSIIFHCIFVILTMCFIIFHCFFQLYGTTESYIATLVERHGFQEKPVYRMRNRGGI